MIFIEQIITIHYKAKQFLIVFYPAGKREKIILINRKHY